MSIEQLLADHTAALNNHAAALTANTAALSGAEPAKKTRKLKEDTSTTTASAATAATPAASATTVTPNAAVTTVTPTAAAAPPQPAATATAQAQPAASPAASVSLKDVSDKFTTLARGNRDAAVLILKKFGVERLSMVKADKLPDVLALIEAALNPQAATPTVSDSLI